MSVASDPGEAFWQFSLAVYGRPGVAAACLQLQDGWQLDVNLLLFCLHAANQGRVLTVSELHALDAEVQAWREQVVRPLRAVRRWLKSPSLSPAWDVGGLRQELQGIELQSERHQQRAMARLLVVAPGKPSTTAAESNLQACAQAAGCDGDPALHRALQALLAASQS